MRAFNFAIESGGGWSDVVMFNALIEQVKMECALELRTIIGLYPFALDVLARTVIIRSIMPLSEEMTSEDAEQPPRDYEITITDCNSITRAQISLRRSALNIKYGPNGIGKSTIARALVLRSEGDEALGELLPFKYREGSGHPKPTVVGSDEILNVLVFDDY